MVIFVTLVFQGLLLPFVIKLIKLEEPDDVHATQVRLTSLEQCETDTQQVQTYHKILLDIYLLQRKELFKLRKENFFSDEEIRKAEQQLDLNQLKIEKS